VVVLLLSEAATATAATATPTTAAVPTVTPPTSVVLINGAGATGTGAGVGAGVGSTAAVCANTCAETRLRIAAVARIFFIGKSLFSNMSEQKLVHCCFRIITIAKQITPIFWQSRGNRLFCLSD
jgi:hypothetical protein